MISKRMIHETDESVLNKIVNALQEGRYIEYNGSKEKLNENFCIEETLASTDIKVTVNGVGVLSFPLSKACVQKLINVSTTAKFGMGERTVLDKNVRNTQVIDSKSLDVVINQEALTRLTNNMWKALDFPTDSTLIPHLYNMLIYGPGQFFNKHRDSEKLQNMVATLVIILPSPHIGGDLIIQHGSKEHIFYSQNINKNLKCICFYSDCLHKVNKVQRGYRVALTFNVVRKTGELPDAGPCTNHPLKTAVQDYFNTETAMDKPKKIIFLLNHTYTEHSLLWNLLKGEDGRYASSFRPVARELDLEIYLVLANIRQTWSSADEYEADPDWLINTDSTLTCWVDENNVKLPYAEYSIMESETCFARETHEDFEATEAEFSGPTGNAGTTVDYWYKRAAIVLWRKSNSLMIKFEINYDGAMADVRTLISVPGNEKNVMVILDKAAKLSQKGRPTRNDFETFVNVALYVKAKKEALAVLYPFHLDVLIPENVHLLARLQQQYDTDWLIELLSALRRSRVSYGYSNFMIIEAINPFILKFLNSGCDRSVVKSLLNAEVSTFKQYVRSNAAPKVVDLKQPQELFKACAAIGSVELQKELAQFLTSQPKSFPKGELVELYHELEKTLSLESSQLFRAYLEQGIQQELSSQTRDPDDWSLSEELSCSCAYCDALSDFLRSKSLKSKTWLANEKICNHVTSKLKRSDAPVNVNIDRTKIPYSMVLIKSATLHADAVTKCAELKAMLQNLRPKSAAKKRELLMEYHNRKHQKL